MATKHSQNIVLVGFMGVGKSAVGSRLAARLGRKLIDTDEWVEARAGMRVAEIFARFGEGEFRRRERECAEILATQKQKNLVIATGGGFYAHLAGAGAGANFGSGGGANSNLTDGANAAQNPAQNGVKLGRVIWLKADFDEILRHLNDGAKLGENFNNKPPHAPQTVSNSNLNNAAQTAPNLNDTAQNLPNSNLTDGENAAQNPAQSQPEISLKTPPAAADFFTNAAKKRPLFKDAASAKRLFDARQAGYAAVANFAIDVRGKNANEVAQCILDLIK